MSERGFFLVTDITGYTAFMSGSELDHAQDIIQSLMRTLLAEIRPPFELISVQGDAILILAAEQAVAQGQTILEAIETLYFAFARALDLMQHNTTCTCQACANMGLLDLKVFLHAGDFARQQIGRRSDITGSDVIIVHRMMKNRVREQLGIRAYALISDGAIRSAAMEALCASMPAYVDSYDHIGQVSMRVHDLKAAWQLQRSRKRIEVSADDASVERRFELPLAVPQAWEYVNHAEGKRLLRASTHLQTENLIEGRLGIGSTQHCYHGQGNRVSELIEDWRPFELATTRDTLPYFGFGAQVYVSTLLEAISPATTCVTVRLGSPFHPDPLRAALSRVVWAIILRRLVSAALDQGIQQLQAEVSAAKASIQMG